jgi:protein-tyrosine phosphatase
MASPSRQIEFESVFNFRDLGGFQNLEGRMVARRRLFRCASLSDMTGNDLNKLVNELGLHSVLDLRSKVEIEKRGIGLLAGSGIEYFNISFISDGGDPEGNKKRYDGLKNMGEFYITLAGQKEFGQRIVEALGLIADSTHHPLAFHCFTGKDRTGLLAAFILSVLKVPDESISSDYSLSASFIEKFIADKKKKEQVTEEEKSLPDYFWQVSADSMGSFLIALRQRYGSVRDYLKEHGADSSLFDRLERTLLT